MAKIGVDVTKAQLEYSAKVGDSLVPNTNNVVPVATTQGTQNVRLGCETTISGTGNVAVGYEADVLGNDSIHIGKGTNNETSATGAVAIGSGADVSADGGIAIGLSAEVTSPNAVQLGSGTNDEEGTLKFNNLTIVDENGVIPKSLTGVDNVNERIDEIHSVKIGENVSNDGQKSIAIGVGENNYETKADKNYSIAIGTGAQVIDSWAGSSENYGPYGVAIGYGAQSGAEGAIQLGDGLNITKNSLKFRNTLLIDSTGHIYKGALPLDPLTGKLPNDLFVFMDNNGKIYNHYLQYTPQKQLVAGSNITLNDTGRSVTISASGGGGGGATEISGEKTIAELVALGVGQYVVGENGLKITGVLDAEDGETEITLISVEGDNVSVGENVLFLDANSDCYKILKFDDGGTITYQGSAVSTWADVSVIKNHYAFNDYFGSTSTAINLDNGLYRTSEPCTVTVKTGSASSKKDVIEDFEGIAIRTDMQFILLGTVNRIYTKASASQAYFANKENIGGGTVDTAMSDSSTNAVQNRVIKAYVDAAIADVSELIGEVV